jgi:hypothetical protein
MARVGYPFSATVSTSDPNSGTAIILNSAGLPAGLVATPVLPVSGNPATADLSWTSTLADLGNHVVSFTATDPCGAQSLRSFTIRVVQNHPPVAIAGPDTTVECGSTGTTPVRLSGLRSTDPEGDALTYAWSASGVSFDDPTAAAPLGQFPHGSTTVVLTVSDGEFSSTTTQVVTVADTQPPIITLLGPNPTTVECHGTFTDPGATASDVCAGVLPIAVFGTVNPNTPGTYVLTYAAFDGVDSAAVSRTVHVVDTTAPVITLNGVSPMTVECHGTFTDPGATASDLCAGALTVAVFGTVNPNTPGTYVLTYGTGDGVDSAYVSRTVHVVDTTPPVVTLNGPNPMTVECHGTFTDPGATASDACAGALPATVSGTVDPNTRGTYTLVYSATDGFQSASVSRTVHVVDTTLPVVTVLGANPITVDCHGTFTDPGATASDACAGPLSVTVSGTVDPNTAASYTLTYRATDGTNIGSATRTVNVVDHTAPSITVTVTPVTMWPPHKKLVDVHATVSVSDPCDPSVVVTLTSITLTCGGDPWIGKDPKKPSVEGADFGTADFDFQLRAEKDPKGHKHDCDPTYLIVYTATDHAGNSATGSTTVRVRHDKHGDAMASAAGGMGPSGMGQARSLRVVIPSVAAVSATDEGGGESDLQLHTPPPATGLVFDAGTVESSQIWLGTSQGLIQPSDVQRTDVTGDGFADLVASFSAAALRILATQPVEEDDPVTLYYQTRDRAGFEIEGLLGTGWQMGFLPDPGLARVGPQTESGTEPALALPRVTQLSAGAPNPAHGAMTFALDLAGEADTRIEVYDLRGARVRTLMNGVRSEGHYVITWDGTNANGVRVANGIYLVRAEAGAYHATRKAVLMK